jgi:hypothetical protein
VLATPVLVRLVALNIAQFVTMGPYPRGLCSFALIGCVVDTKVRFAVELDIVGNV